MDDRKYAAPMCQWLTMQAINASDRSCCSENWLSYGTYTVQKIFDDNHSQQTSVFAGISTLDSRSDATPILIGCELPTNVIRPRDLIQHSKL
jgi:hypothetical protein